MTIKNAEKLIQEVKKKRMKVEYNVGTFKGVRNLSVSDLDSIELYAETYIANGGTGFSGLMQPMGEVKEVLDRCELVEKNNFGW